MTERIGSDKENYVKLPSLNSVALKHVCTHKEPLAIIKRNILEDAMRHCEQQRNRSHKIQHLAKVKKVKCSEPIKPISPNFKLNFQKNTEPLR